MPHTSTNELTLSPAQLRRIALAQLGLTGTNPYGSGTPGTRKAIEALGYVQIDTISVVARAHDHILHSRVANYSPTNLRRLLQQRHVFEYWDHAAAFMPIDHYRFALPRQHALRAGELKWLKNRDAKTERMVLDRIAAEGPLRARDFDSPKQGEGNGWWSWKPAKRALESLFLVGDLMIADRDGFQKVYDLTERVLPDHVATQMPSAEEHADFVIDRTLGNFGMVSAKSACYLQRLPKLRKAVLARFDERLYGGDLQPVRLPGGALVGVPANALARAPNRIARRMRVLSPFDPLVIQRERAQHLFGFDYQIECYVPEDKRRYGYYCLPLLYGDRLCGRMDSKAHRNAARFDIRALHLEPDCRVDDAFCTEFVRACSAYAAFNGCTDIRLERVEPATAALPLQQALAQALT